VLSRAKEDVVMLVELSMVEQRYDAVQEVLDGATITDVATRYGVDRRTLHRWLVRTPTRASPLSPTAAPSLFPFIPRARPA
jgi:transposase-like protein